MSHTLRYYGCPECNTTRNHPGLCRFCTDYDEDLRPLEPVVRLIHVDEFGNPIIRAKQPGKQTFNQRTGMPLQGAPAGFRSRKKPSKKARAQKKAESQRLKAPTDIDPIDLDDVDIIAEGEE